MTDSRASFAGRVAALVAGLAILIIAALTSLGAVLAAPLGIWIARRFRRARGQTLGGLDSWIGAVSGTLIAVLLLSGGIASLVPKTAWHQIRQAADSASVQSAKEPPPAWLNRIAPATNRPALSAVQQPAALVTFEMIWGVVFAMGILSGVLGTVGWLGTMLLMFYSSGHWLRPAPTEPQALLA